MESLIVLVKSAIIVSPSALQCRIGDSSGLEFPL